MCAVRASSFIPFILSLSLSLCTSYGDANIAHTRMRPAFIAGVFVKSLAQKNERLRVFFVAVPLVNQLSRRKKTKNNTLDREGG